MCWRKVGRREGWAGGVGRRAGPQAWRDANWLCGAAWAQGCQHRIAPAAALLSALPRRRPAGAKQAAEILGPDALELAALYDQLCVIRFLHERMEAAAEAGAQAACGHVGGEGCLGSGQAAHGGGGGGGCISCWCGHEGAIVGGRGGKRPAPAWATSRGGAPGRCALAGGLQPWPPALHPPAAAAAKKALDILKQHDAGFGPATAIAATRLASTLLATGSPQEAQVGWLGAWAMGRRAGKPGAAAQVGRCQHSSRRSPRRCMHAESTGPPPLHPAPFLQLLPPPRLPAAVHGAERGGAGAGAAAAGGDPGGGRG